MEIVALTVTAYTTVTTDITDDILRPYYAEWGVSRDERVAKTGVIEFDLRNYGAAEGKYLPGHGNALAGWRRGTPVEFSYTYNGSTFKQRWYIDTCFVSGSIQERVHVVAVDWMDMATKYPIVNPSLLQDQYADDGVTEILSGMPIQPQSTNLEQGDIKLPTQFDTTSGYTKAYTEFAKLTASELGYIYLQKDQTNGEKLVLEKYSKRNGLRTLRVVPKATSSLGYLKRNSTDKILTSTSANNILVNEADVISITQASGDILSYENASGKNIVNRMVVNAYPRRMDTDSKILYQPERNIQLVAGQSLTFRGFFSDPDNKGRTNAVPPTEEGHFKSVLHFEGTKGHTKIIPDDTGRTWTPTDVEFVDDVFGVEPPFGDTCIYFDGGNSYITSPHSPDFNPITGDFTFAWLEYRFNTTSGKTSISRDGSIATPAYRFGRSDGANLRVDISSNGSSYDIANGRTLGTITTGRFVHLAVVRSGSNFYTFKDGVIQDTWTSSAGIHIPTSGDFTIGKAQTVYIDAAMDEFVYSRSALWTSDFTPPSVKRSIQGTFASMWSNENGTGTDLSDKLTVSVQYGTEGATYTLTNNATQTGWVVMRTLGYSIHQDSPVEHSEESSASILDNGYQEKTLSQVYLQSTALGELEAQKVIEENKDSRDELLKIEMSANKNSANMVRFLYGEIGDLINVNIPDINKDAYYYIQSIKYNYMGAGLITFFWELKEAYTIANGLSDMAVEFAGGASADGLEFSYMPYVSGDEVSAFSISAWIYMNSVPASNFYFVAGAYMDGAGSMLYIPQDASNRHVGFYTSRWATAPGTWKNAANQFALSAWNHVVVTYSLSSVANDPVIYVNNAVQTLTESSAPTGALQSAVGCPFFIGNVNTPSYPYNRAFDGRLYDVRYYPYTLTSADVSDIYNGGTKSDTSGSNGLVFQAPFVRTRNYTAYTNLTLTSDKKMLDAYLTTVSTPNGSPVARVP